jgi:hypothetical protein
LGESWLADVGIQVVRRWFALAGIVATLVSVVGFAVSEWRWWAWIAIAALGLLVVALAWTLADMHTLADQSSSDRVGDLRLLLVASAQRLEHVATTDKIINPKWVFDQCIERSTETYKLLDHSLGPAVADEYSRVNGNGDAGLPGVQSTVGAKAAFVRSLLVNLDARPIMEDWKP